MKLRLHDILAHEGIDYRVLAQLRYQLEGSVYIAFQLQGAPGTRYLGLPHDDRNDRLLWLAEISLIEIDPPFPKVIDWRGESYLLNMQGLATLEVDEGEVSAPRVEEVSLWRYRAAGDVYLQIESRTDGLRMFAGPSVHRGMLEVRPVT